MPFWFGYSQLKCNVRNEWSGNAREDILAYSKSIPSKPYLVTISRIAPANVERFWGVTA